MNPLTMGINLAKDGAQWAAAGFPLTPSEDLAKRLLWCNDCDERNGDRCKQCGCFIKPKAQLATSRCPLGKWTLSASYQPPPGTWFFGLSWNEATLLRELESWRGTPFAPCSGGWAAKGAGCDCVSFVERVLVATGAILPIEWPAYVTRGGGAAMLSLLENTLGQIPALVRLDDLSFSTLIPGDVLLGSMGAALHHLAIFSGRNTVWHALKGPGVCTGNIFDPLIREHTRAIYRVKFL